MTPPSSIADLSPADRAACGLASPGAFYMTGEDALQISGWNITASARLRASVRFLGLDGRVQASEHDLALTTDRVIASLVRQLGEGWLLGLTVRVVGATSPYGATFARAQIVRGVDASGIVLGTLCAGYVTGAQPAVFPGGRVQSMVEGPGNIRGISGTNPAAGVEVTETVPTGARWRLISFLSQLVCDATAANRIPLLVIDDAVTTRYLADPGAALTANQGFNLVAGDSFNRSTAVSATQQWAVPRLPLLLAGWRILTATTSLQAGDNWGQPQLWVEEWLDAL